MANLRVSLPDRTASDTLRFRVEMDRPLRKYFAAVYEIRYPRPVEDLDSAMLFVPYVAAVMPAVWVLDATLEVPQIDAVFADSLDRVRSGFADMYPSVPFTGRLVTERRSVTLRQTSGSAALFSGGIDSIATAVAHESESPVFITLNSPEDLQDGTAGRRRAVATALAEGLRTARYEIVADPENATSWSRLGSLFAEITGWWGHMQHALALTGTAAPLMTALGRETLYIPSSHVVGAEDLPWGSHPRIDNEIRWTGGQVSHDLYELGRQRKLALVADYLRRSGAQFEAQVCQELPGGANCSRCEKCYRTIVGLMLEGVDPRELGFDFSRGSWSSVRAMMERGEIVFTANERIMWGQIQEAIDPVRLLDEEGFGEFASWLAAEDLDARLQEAAGKNSIYRRFKRWSNVLPDWLRQPLRRMVVRARGNRV